MGTTRYGRPYLLRMTEDERSLLVTLVMSEIETYSHALNAAGGGTVPGKRRLRTLRGLLERLSSS